MRDADLQARVSRLRQIISESVPVEEAKSDVEVDAWRRFQRYAANEPMPASDDSDYARKVRNINRIACSYGWIGELQHQLDRYEASSIQSLSRDQLEALHQRMVQLEACVQDGCDPPDAPHAR
jgi:hypothetical protein